MSAHASSPARTRRRGRGLTREALAYLAPTEAIVYQIECHVALGEALAAGGRPDEARRRSTTPGLAERKGGVVILTGVLRRLEDLDAAPRTT